MERVFKLLLFFWILSVFSPNNDTLAANVSCIIINGNNSQNCPFSIGNRTETLHCNNSLSKIIVACNDTGNHSCNLNQTVNSSGCNLPDKRSSSSTGQDKTSLAIQIAFYGFVFVVGVAGNLLVLLTVTSKRMRSVRNMLIGNLAVADLITLLVCLPLSLITLLVSWPFGSTICRYFFPITDVVVSVSIITICVITMDRFRAIVYPFAKKMSLKVTLIVLVTIWLLSYVVVALPLIQLMNIKPLQSGRLVCTPHWPTMLYKKAYRLVILIALYIIPVTLVFFCFICIVKRIRENIRFTRQTVRDSRSLARIQRRSRVVRMMFVIFITFTICLLPIHLLLTMMAFYPPTSFWPPLNKVYHASLVILTANSAMNPIILYILSSDFKRGFHEHCICFALFVRIRGKNEAPLSKRSRSFNNQQLTTCLHLSHGRNDMTTNNIHMSTCQQSKELLRKHNNNQRNSTESGKGKGSGVETAL